MNHLKIACFVVCVVLTQLWLGPISVFSPSSSNDDDDEASSITTSSDNKLQVNVNVQAMKALRQYMMEAQKTYPNYHAECPGIMLRFLKEQAPDMFPLLDTVPITGNKDGVVPDSEFVGQELEDKALYERFWNEHTQQCHPFGPDGVFESGAYKGVMWSNTYFFEQHFGAASILVEASHRNWVDLDRAVEEHRPNASVHHAALCPIGDETVCLDSSPGPASEAHKVNRESNGVTSGGETTTNNAACEQSIPCFDFDDSLQYAFISLDIEGFEWEFLKFRQLKADIILVEVIQWLRQSDTLLTVVEFTSYMVEELGYYLYAPSPDVMVGARNFVYVSRSLVDNCFTQHRIDPRKAVSQRRHRSRQ